MQSNEPEQNDEPIGMESSEVWMMVKSAAAGTVVAFCGLAFFAGMLTPRRTMGASQAARLSWQQHQTELHSACDAVAKLPADIR
jgi:hypothetical protein